jgi:pimeloyl-ACP methyl ester carboxylesterase
MDKERHMQKQDSRLIRVGDAELCAEIIGTPGDPPLLLIGNSMLAWPDGLCRRLVEGGRLVIRYDLRDTGRSTFTDPQAPTYTLRDLVADAAGLLDALGLPAAHVAGYGVGGWIAQLLALDHPEKVESLTLVATRPTAPGPPDPDLPDHAHVVMEHLFGVPQPDWADRAAVVDAMVSSGRVLAGGEPYDEAAARKQAGRIFDRAVAAHPDADPAKLQPANHMAIAFAAMDSGERWRERLGEIAVPALVIHGADDPFFPFGNGEALAREIPGAELLALPRTGQDLPARVWGEVAAAMLRVSSS